MENKEIVLQVGVKVLLKNKEGKFLLLRRNPKKYPEVGAQWDIVGGRINPGQTLFENLKREVLEETKLKLEKEPRLISAQDILRVAGRHVVRLSYLGEIDGQPEIDEESHEFKWFAFEEIKNIPVKELDQYFKELFDKGLIKP